MERSAGPISTGGHPNRLPTRHVLGDRKNLPQVQPRDLQQHVRSRVLRILRAGYLPGSSGRHDLFHVPPRHLPEQERAVRLPALPTGMPAWWGMLRDQWSVCLSFSMDRRSMPDFRLRSSLRPWNLRCAQYVHLQHRVDRLSMPDSRLRSGLRPWNLRFARRVQLHQRVDRRRL